ncbi:hypothetical protein GCM10007049_39220 [Echinicola pacifica]|uniref:Uncharacterized protein n=1 Tax=Echinicola pacifica TaxID=346377 RepID=A0A918QD29_9BACT|nr:hypothetical protein [Echinicola pacifica]GGZ42165.1 hypothetical protein GCM10007049_39220 [Echinicola pacifica]
MSNPFQDIVSDEKLPEILRQKVIDDINLIKLSIDMADLFMIKSPGVLGTLFDSNDDNEDE